ncbi:MAG TPA: DUF4097 family beta strand repeat-containing protein [Gemmatimonadaceae bacterium]|nr:DUF4097 family beta strand repeat-containing protein [Gemmatimonadaceae bacterium]
MRTILRGTIALAALAVLSAPLGAQAAGVQNGDTFDWSGAIPAGSWLRVKNLNGAVEVEAASGDQASVHAVKEYHGDADPKRVHFIVTKDGNNVTVCALWHEGDTCDESGYHSHSDGDHHNNVSVHFTVNLPKGVQMNAGTVNGDVRVSGATAPVKASTVNGSVEATTTSGPVDASTVNGDVHVRMDALTGDGDLRYNTVNGSITADLPANLNAEIDLETVNGSLTSDFPITLTGSINPRHHIHATIGSGGRHIEFHTVNGSVELKKLS